MRVAPVSADLLVKLALLGVVVVGGIWAVRRIAGTASGVYDDFSNAVGQGADFVQRQAQTTFNPASDQNFVYGGVNAVGSGFTGDSSWTLGGALYDLFNPDPMVLAQRAEEDRRKREAEAETARLLARYPKPIGSDPFVSESGMDYRYF